MELPKSSVDGVVGGGVATGSARVGADVSIDVHRFSDQLQAWTLHKSRLGDGLIRDRPKAALKQPGVLPTGPGRRLGPSPGSTVG